MHDFENMLSASGGFALKPHRGSALRPNWGSSVLHTFIAHPWKKILRAPGLEDVRMFTGRMPVFTPYRQHHGAEESSSFYLMTS